MPFGGFCPDFKGWQACGCMCIVGDNESVCARIPPLPHRPCSPVRPALGLLYFWPTGKGRGSGRALHRAHSRWASKALQIGTENIGDLSGG